MRSKGQVGRRSLEARGDAMTRDFAVIPVKGLLESKSRLSHSLGSREKKKLILAMLKDVLTSVEESELFSRVLVVSPDQHGTAGANLPDGSCLHQEVQGL